MKTTRPHYLASVHPLLVACQIVSGFILDDWKQSGHSQTHTLCYLFDDLVSNILQLQMYGSAISQVNNLREIQALRRLSPHEHIIGLEEVGKRKWICVLVRMCVRESMS